jgi:phosphatidylglycerophosphate synthase
MSQQHATRHKLWWLPNAITLFRPVLAIIALVAALHGAWASAFWLFTAALATDFLDGLAAKKLNARSKFGEEFDAISDSATVTLGILSLSITHQLSWWITGMLFAIGAVISSDRVFTQPVWKWRAIVAVASLFMGWTGIAWFYASLAFGWSWAFVPATLIILLACAALKRHRIKAWFGQNS